MNSQAAVARRACHMLATLVVLGLGAALAQPARADTLRPARGQSLRRPQEVVAIRTAAAAAAEAATEPLASGTLKAQTNLFSGPESAEFSVNVPGPGDLDVQLSSINVGSAVGANLSLSVDSATNVLESVSGVTGIDVLTPLPVSGPETLFINLTGQATGSLDLGLYSVNVTFTQSVVPLPPSLWLLLAGLAGLAGMRVKTAVRQTA